MKVGKMPGGVRDTGRVLFPGVRDTGGVLFPGVSDTGRVLFFEGLKGQCHKIFEVGFFIKQLLRAPRDVF